VSEFVTPATTNPIGESKSFAAMLAHVSALAPLNRPVLIIGERGTGKEIVANRLKFLSPRWNRPYLTLNCGALAEGVLDSELFGHDRQRRPICAGKTVARHRIRQFRAGRRQRDSHR
jgi:transcriptional regulator with GAF, ATPase, and Fis domain